MTSTWSAVGVARQARSCAPRNDGLMKGPSMCAPRTRAPLPSADATAAAKSAPTRTGAEIRVGRNAVTPVAGRASEMASIALRPSAASWPPKPLTCRSMKPGASSSPGSSSITSSARGDVASRPIQEMTAPSTRTPLASPAMPCTRPRKNVLTAAASRPAQPQGRRPRPPDGLGRRPRSHPSEASGWRPMRFQAGRAFGSLMPNRRRSASR